MRVRRQGSSESGPRRPLGEAPGADSSRPQPGGSGRASGRRKARAVHLSLTCGERTVTGRGVHAEPGPGQPLPSRPGLLPPHLAKAASCERAPQGTFRKHRVSPWGGGDALTLPNPVSAACSVWTPKASQPPRAPSLRPRGARGPAATMLAWRRGREVAESSYRQSVCYLLFPSPKKPRQSPLLPISPT